VDDAIAVAPMQRQCVPRQRGPASHSRVRKTRKQSKEQVPSMDLGGGQETRPPLICSFLIHIAA